MDRIDLISALVPAVLGVIRLIAWLDRVAPDSAAYVAKQGEAVRGWVVHGGTLPRGAERARALVLITFAEIPDREMEALALRVAELATRMPVGRDEAEVATIIRDFALRSEPLRRSRLPRSISAKKVYLVEVDVNRALLPLGRIALPYVRCRALTSEGRSLVVMTTYLPIDPHERIKRVSTPAPVARPAGPYRSPQSSDAGAGEAPSFPKVERRGTSA